MMNDRRSDGPTLLQATVALGGRRWGRRQASMTVRVTSRCLHWGTAGEQSSLLWTEIQDVEEVGGVLHVRYRDDDQEQVLAVELQGPVGYLLAEDVRRRAEAAARNHGRRLGATPAVGALVR